MPRMNVMIGVEFGLRRTQHQVMMWFRQTSPKVHNHYAYKVFVWYMVLGLRVHNVVVMDGYGCWRGTTHRAEEQRVTNVFVTFWSKGYHLAMQNMTQHTSCHHFETYCNDIISKIKDPRAWPSFFMELADFTAIRRRFQDFNIIYVPRAQNRTADALAKDHLIFSYESSFRWLLYFGLNF